MTFGHEELRENTLHLQQSYTGKAWSPTSKYIYVEASNTWVKVQDQGIGETKQTKGTKIPEAEKTPTVLHPVLPPAESQVTLTISIQDPQIKSYRYQFNGERASKWTTTTTEQPVMTFGHEELRENTLHLQQSYTGKAWSPTSKYIYVEASNTWIKVQEAQTKSTLSLDAETHANLPLGVYQEYYQRGIGGKVQLNKAWSNNITSGASFSYTYGVSKTSRVNDFHKLQLIGVVGYELPILKAVSLIPELGLGALLHMPVGTVFVNGTAGVHYFVDFVAEAGLKVTLHIGPIIQIYTAPRFKLFAEANSVGMLGELAIGTTVAL